MVDFTHEPNPAGGEVEVVEVPPGSSPDAIFRLNGPLFVTGDEKEVERAHQLLRELVKDLTDKLDVANLKAYNFTIEILRLAPEEATVVNLPLAKPPQFLQ